jgi:hypothetical protein
MAERPKRVDIGFAAGAILQLRMTDEVYEGLRKALGDERASRWHELKTEDSEVAVDLAQIIYVRLDTERHKVGF